MIFLIQYDREKSLIEHFEPFDPSRRLEAESKRLAIELDLLGKQVVREVVLLDAADKQALIRTHARYFKTPSQIAGSMFTEDPTEELTPF